MKIKKFLIGATLFSFACLSLILYSSNAFADDKPNRGRSEENEHSSRVFNPDKQLSNSACGDRLGNPVINITQKVQNDADSGQAGNYWAFDYYKRHIKVWQTGSSETGNTYCAIVTYDGDFYAVPGQVGPGNTPPGALINTSTDEPVHGKMSGGRRALITGTLLSPALWPTNGSVGTTNYQCDITGNCPGVISWPGQYFTAGYGYTDAWWGWKYNGGSHGTWVNAISGNSGNIL